jgi:hypothetical protein
MHYYLSADYKCGPIFWNRLVMTRLIPGDVLTTAEVGEDIRRSLDESETQRSSRDTLRAASAFLGTYSKADGLAGLGILRPPEDGSYAVGEPVPLESLVFAYVLADYWRAVWGEVVSVNLSSVTGTGGPAALLLQSSGAASRMLRDLQERGLVEVQRRVPPYQVMRLWRDPESLLERVYVS